MAQLVRWQGGKDSSLVMLDFPREPAYQLRFGRLQMGDVAYGQANAHAQHQRDLKSTHQINHNTLYHTVTTRAPVLTQVSLIATRSAGRRDYLSETDCRRGPALILIT